MAPTHIIVGMRSTSLRTQFVRLALLFGAVAVTAFFINACKSGTSANGSAANNSAVGSTSGGGGSSPTEAYKNLFAAVKSKNSDEIKKQLSKGTLQFAQMVAAQQHKTVDQVVENGFLASTFSPTLPEMRDERINGSNGAVEVFNIKNSQWEDAPFILEDGSWKLAVGNAFQGTWNLPGKPQSAREMEAANAAGKGPQVANANVNFNAVKPIVPKERPEANVKK